MLGSDSTHAGCYRHKHESDFPSHFAVSRNMQLAILVLLVGLNIFFILLCMSYGLQKGYEWQIMWIVAVMLKVFIELAVTPIIESLVLDYGLPSLIKRDIFLVIQALLASSKRIVNDKKCFHLNQFSSTDYVHASSLLAREMPDLLEAKIVLMYRDTLPDRLVQGRALRVDAGKERSNGSIKHSIVLSVVTTLVYVSSLDANIQKVLVYCIPGMFIVVFGFLLVNMTPFSFMAMLLVFVILFLVGPVIVHAISRAMFPNFHSTSFAARDRRLTREHGLVLPMTSRDLSQVDMEDSDGVLKLRGDAVRPAKGTVTPFNGNIASRHQSWWQKTENDVVSDDSDDPDSYKSLLAHIKSVENGTLEEDKKAAEEEAKIQAAISAAEIAAIDAAVYTDVVPSKATVSLTAMEEGDQANAHQVAATEAAAAATAVSECAPFPGKLVSVQSIRSSFISLANVSSSSVSVLARDAGTDAGVSDGTDVGADIDSVESTDDGADDGADDSSDDGAVEGINVGTVECIGAGLIAKTADAARVSDLERDFAVAEIAHADALTHQKNVADKKLEKRLAGKMNKTGIEGSSESTKKAAFNDMGVTMKNEATATVESDLAVQLSDKDTRSDGDTLLVQDDTDATHTKTKNKTHVKKKKKKKKKSKMKKGKNAKRTVVALGPTHAPVDNATEGSTKTSSKTVKKANTKKPKKV